MDPAPVLPRAAAALALVALLSSCTSAFGEPSGSPLAAPGTAASPPDVAPPPAADAVVPHVELPYRTTADVADLEDAFASWQEAVPRVQAVRVRSTRDDSLQPALLVPPVGPEPQPLLVVLHSWSTRHVAAQSIPFAAWAARSGWAVVAPDFRGAFDSPDATGSALAVQDVVDALRGTVARGGVDPRRVYVTGFSGGGMMSLLVAAQHPELFAGVVSWVPVHDLQDWHRATSDEDGRAASEGYTEEIEDSCGGDPQTDPAAAASCAERSPSTHLERLREARLPVLLGAGLADTTVPPDHALRAYDQLAAPQDRVGRAVDDAVAAGELPAALRARSTPLPWFDEQDPAQLLGLRSGPVSLALFEGEHDIVYGAGNAWLAAHEAAREAQLGPES